MLNFFKMKHSNCLIDCENIFEKQQNCETMNKEMKFEAPFLLNPLNIQPNKSKRLFLQINGKFNHWQAWAKK